MMIKKMKLKLIELFLNNFLLLGEGLYVVVRFFIMKNDNK